MNKQASQSLYNTFSRISLRFERGEGAWLYTEGGEPYLDFTSGIAVNSLGHANPYLVKELKKQVDKLWHTSNLFESPTQEKLADILCENSFADKVFFCNSGAEAIECAIKTARHYHYNNGNSERVEIITFEGAFHGRTLATLAAGGQQKYLDGFGPKAAGFVQVPFCDDKALKAAINENTAAILIEPIQGESGIRAVSDTTLRKLRALCDQHDLLLIFDEVQTGIGRTGKLFAYEWANVAPDIMAIAKGIGGGFPLGACLATEDAAKSMVPGTHGSTFGGNPLAMAAGSAVLEVLLAPGFLDHVTKMGNIMKQGLAAIIDQYSDVISDITGKGLLVGVKCVLPNTEIIEACRDEKFLTVAAGANVMRILPPLNVTEEEIRDGLNRLEQASEKLSKKYKEK